MAKVNNSGIDSIWENQVTLTTPLADPIKALYGFEVGAPPLINGSQFDLEDFSKDASKKKEMFPVSLTDQETLESITLSSSIEGSIFQEKDWNEMLILLKNHYGRVAVPGGFDWAIRLVNLKPVLHTLNLWDKLPEWVTATWDDAILVAFALVYEAWGLGGLDAKALEFHSILKTLSIGAYLDVEELDIFQAEYLDNQLAGGDDTDLAFKVFRSLIPNEIGVRFKDDALINNIFEILLFSATCRAMVAKFKKNRELSKFQSEYTALDLENQEISFLALCGQVLRDGAKGKMDFAELPLAYQLQAHPLWDVFIGNVVHKQRNGQFLSVSEMTLVWAVKMKGLGVARKNEIENDY